MPTWIVRFVLLVIAGTSFRELFIDAAATYDVAPSDSSQPPPQDRSSGRPARGLKETTKVPERSDT